MMTAYKSPECERDFQVWPEEVSGVNSSVQQKNTCRDLSRVLSLSQSLEMS